jgi:hypothetical protein
MVVKLDITNYLWQFVFGASSIEESITAWLISYVGEETKEPGFQYIPEGSYSKIHCCGEDWIITMENLYVENPVSEQEWSANTNIGSCQLPYSRTISTTKYFLHLKDPGIAIQFKLLWL